uniref:Transmembrane domain-containing protein n=1 Tax=Spironucleus salmonicida TaxID=348837 RepID=V6LTA2_9EUKA|eukprot:EST47877.1 Transmembrane domain-containing protein [Spironucleus salmonicida]
MVEVSIQLSCTVDCVTHSTTSAASYINNITLWTPLSGSSQNFVYETSVLQTFHHPETSTNNYGNKQIAGNQPSQQLLMVQPSKMDMSAFPINFWRCTQMVRQRQNITMLCFYITIMVKLIISHILSPFCSYNTIIRLVLSAFRFGTISHLSLHSFQLCITNLLYISIQYKINASTQVALHLQPSVGRHHQTK